MLDRFMPQDAEAVFAMCQDPEIQRYTSVPVPYGLEDARGYIAEHTTDADIDLWAIRREGVLVGSIELRGVQPGITDLGYLLHSDHRGRGLMTEAVRTVVEHGLSSGALDVIRWRAIVGNTASAVVARRAGFAFLGVVTDGLEIRGVRHDVWTAEFRGTPKENTPWPI